MPYHPHILIIDDEESIRIGCAQSLENEGWRVFTVANGLEGLDSIGRESFDVVVVDLKMPGLDGIEVLRRIKANDPQIRVIVMTGYGTIDTAVESMRLGAFDFITKPFTPEALCEIVRAAVDNRMRNLELSSIESLRPGTPVSLPVVGRSPAIGRVIQLAQKVAPTNSTVLIYGETGTGKELIAQTIHRLSSRKDGPFVTVDCGTLVESLFENELFGHVKGSFTGATETTRGKFEQAEGGTIFLDEIANISMFMQARLLRVIQEREITKIGSSEKILVNVRIAAATNKDLTKEIREGRFREDLFYRLNVVPIVVPSLRERTDDIPVLIDYFVASYCTKQKRTAPTVSDEAYRAAEQYEWPGNIRELKNAVEFALVVCENNVIKAGDLVPLRATQPRSESLPAPDGSLAESEKNEILRALGMFDYAKAKAAEYLGINRKTLREKMRKYGIPDKAS